MTTMNGRGAQTYGKEMKHWTGLLASMRSSCLRMACELQGGEGVSKWTGSDFTINVRQRPPRGKEAERTLGLTQHRQPHLYDAVIADGEV